jgi:hypothetical protein
MGIGWIRVFWLMFKTERKPFFFEKKNQKTFTVGRWGQQRHKSFLLLFFKKEALGASPS